MKGLNKTETKLLKALLNKAESKPTKALEGLKWWTNRGFKLQEQGLSYKAKNGKEYPAIKGVMNNGTQLLLKVTRGGSILVAKDF